MNTLQGIQDEWESACLAVAALAEAEKNATRFDRPGIRKALIEAASARLNLSLELLDAIDADMRAAA